MLNKKKIEVCFSPAIFQYYKDSNAIVVIIDTLRATSAICAAFQNGVKKLIPVKTIDEAREYKKRGFIVAAERDGYVLDFADFGNSPFNFTKEKVKGKTIVYSTTNGTQAIQIAESCYMVVIGSFLNLSYLCNWLVKQGRDVLLLCAGWKNKFNLEDTVLAGAISEKLIATNNYSTMCDSAIASLDLWSLAKPDIPGYIDKAAQRTRLRDKGLDDVIEFCHTPDSVNVIPVLENGYLVELKNIGIEVLNNKYKKTDMKKHNFYAGPSILSEFTENQVIEAIKDFHGTGLSIMSTSHRSKEFVAVMEETMFLFRELLNIPEGYHVLFLGGGASLQFAMLPMNLMNKKAAYLNTGSWAKKAMIEAKNFGEVIEVASSDDKNFSYIPKNYKIPSDADYLHITTNNTIYGTEIKEDMDVDVPLVADMSSDIFSRIVNVSKYVLIYGGAQKNLAPSGLTFVIVKEDALGKVNRTIPTMLDYKTHIEKGSMFNTPPCIAIFAALQTLKWMKNLGGIEVMNKMNREKAELLYGEIERSKIFIPTIINEQDRSIMNVCWVMNKDYAALEKEFFDDATERGMVGIKGHRSVGGFRASIYNALPKNSVEALIALMQEFENQKA